MVGTSGTDAARLSPNIARGPALPALSWLIEAEFDDTSTCALLPRKEVSAGPPPLVGRWRNFKSPAAFMYSAIGMCSAPYNPEEEKMISSGRFFASAVNSASDLYGC